jgi:AcrR family transcriptional regulator
MHGKAAALPRNSDARGKRRAILDGARRVFRKHGYSGASIVEIAARATVSKRTLYQYFRSKQDLFAEIIRDDCARILAPLAFPAIAEQEPRATLRRLAQSIARVTVLGEGPDLYRLVSAEAARFPQLARIFLEQGHEAGAVRLAACFEQWHAAGALNVSHPRFAADLFFAMVNGIRLRLLLGVASEIEQRELNRWIDFVIEVFLRGLEPRGADPPRKRRTVGRALDKCLP